MSDRHRLAATRSGALRFASRLNVLVVALVCLGVAPNLYAQSQRVWIPPEPSTTEKLVMLAMLASMYFWVFVLGSVIGSYLNVVAYRLPKGKPLFWPPSSCPACGSRIAVRDNIPVLGWIVLKGKCRNCRQPISPRYPIVEAVVGLLFVVLAHRELFTDGANLPFREIDDHASSMHLLLFPKALAIALFLFHAAWLATMAAIVLIDLDEQPQPAKAILAWMGAVAVIAVAVQPDLMPVKLAPSGWAHPRVEAVAQSATGLAIGLAAVWLQFQRISTGAFLVLALTGAYFGWQAVFMFFWMTIVIIFLLSLLTFGRIDKDWAPLSFWLAAGAFIHLLMWRQLAEMGRWWNWP